MSAKRGNGVAWISWGVLLAGASLAGLLAAERTPAPLPAEKAAADMTLPPGFHATVFAAEPDVVQPISFCLDDRGRLFVAEALNYGAWQPTGKDRIVILEDGDGDGRADSRKVFYEGLNYVTGIEVGFGGVWAISPPGLYFIPDRDGDDRPDGEPRLLFDGFGHRESRHNLANGFTWGPDGWLYAGHGRTSPSDVGRPGTPPAKRIHCDGGVYRIHPTRLVFESFADGTTNPWGVDFDDFGQCFVSNCVNPHLFHVIQGGHYEPWRGRPSSLYAYQRLPTIADHLHYPEGKPNAMRGETAETLVLGGGHAHCGTLIYLGDQLPASYRNTAFLCNVHGRRINNDILRRKGSGYSASHGKDFMTAADPWFMGVTLRTGPEGSIYVSDWSDTGECHTYQPNRGTGRIYRISHGQPRPARPDLARLDDNELVKLQRHPNDWYVRHARRLLQERAARPGWQAGPVHAALEEMLASSTLDVPRRLRALWALRVSGGLGPERLQSLLGDSSEHVRAWAIQLLCEQECPSAEVLSRLASMAQGDPAPVVRLYLASALQRLPLTRRWPIAEGLLSHPADAADANLPLMIWYGIEPVVPADPDRALEQAVLARIPLVRRHIARRVADQASLQGEKGDLRPLVAVLPRATAEVQRDLLEGARAGLRGRKTMKMPAGWTEAYTLLARSVDPVIREHAQVLAVIFGDPREMARLRGTALSSSTPTPARRAALETLLDRGSRDMAPVLLDLLRDREVREVALRGLASFDHPETPRRVLAVYPQLSPSEKQDAVATLASRKEYALELLEAVAQGAIPRADVSAYSARQIHALGDGELTRRLHQVWGAVRETPAQKQAQIARYRALLTPTYLRKADLRNGRLLFGRSCQQCHKLFGEGEAVGPDLTGSNRDQLDYLLGNLIDPSAEVGRDYRMAVVVTTPGRVITGMILEQTPARLVLRTANERITLAAEEVESITSSPLSIMPEGQLDSLTREEVRDLVAYLASRTQVPLPREK